MFGRGSTDDKGPILGWLNVLEAHHKLGLPLPVNLRFCFEGMEESGSEGLDEFIETEAKKGEKGRFHGVDCVCIVRWRVASVVSQELTAVVSVGQLLAERPYTRSHLWPPWAHVLQRRHLRTRR